ncbi:hypothetical protein OQ496_02745 [Acetobacter suratthaniensis]|uniref:Lipoprotein n=1 Tax=Acetobacter suratthaniensis TaxID=1502841 RepID=A0ABS3LHF0_9PROT|nr:hypothetical protein [Acetobacter suratthaniensis]MBO1327018.1 hypothetical protein [Acetobacter suratthaniensis]MCX2565373.1 hypothetical protein [Acetobacter suratthaniensis]
MKRAVLLLACALGLSACGMFHSTPRHITSPAQLEKLGFRDHIQNSNT